MPTTVLAAAAVAGLGMSAYGMVQQQGAAKQSAEAAHGQSIGAQIQSLGSQQQAAGAQTKVQGAQMQNEAVKQITALEFQAEGQRNQAMELDARRQQMEIVRSGQRARATALTAATSQGAQFGSGLQGGYGQISGDTGVNMKGVQQNLEIGRNIFGINAGISNQRLAYAAGGDVINQGEGQIASGAGTIAQGAGVIAQYGGMGQLASANMSLGGGMMSFGGSLVNNASTLGNLAKTGQSFFGGSSLSGWFNPGGGGGNSAYFNSSTGSLGGLY